MHKSFNIILFFSLGLSLVLFGCGGGSSSDETGVNPTPSAVISGPSEVFVGTSATLSASGSDPQGQILTYEWSLVSRPPGSQSALQPTAGSTTTFTPDTAGQYRVRLTATNTLNLSASTERTVTGRSSFVSDQNAVTRALISTSDAGIAAAAAITTTSNDLRFVKIGANGLQQWERTFGGLRDNLPSAIIEISANEFIVFGDGISPGTDRYAFFMAQITQNSDTMIYFDSFAGDCFLNAAKRLSNGDYLLAGTLEEGNTSRALFATVNASGGGTVVESWPFDGADSGIDIHQASNGDYLLLGEIEISGSDTDIFLARVSSGTPAPVWTRTYGGTGHDLPEAVGDYSGGFFIIGSTNSAPSTQFYDIFILRVDGSGDPIESPFPGHLIGEENGHDFFMSMAKLSPSEGAIIGATQQGGSWNIYLDRIDFTNLANGSGTVISRPQDDLGIFVLPTNPSSPSTSNLRIGALVDGAMVNFQNPANFDFTGSLWVAETSPDGELLSAAATLSSAAAAISDAPQETEDLPAVRFSRSSRR
jgi:hypothetical protein